MPKFLALGLLLYVATSAKADSFYRSIGYTCDRAADQLVIRYKGAYNEEGRAMLEARGENAWNPGELIASMKDDDRIGGLKTITRTCNLKHGTYHLLLGPTPGNYNIQGRCGAVVTAWVEVRLGRRLVLPRRELEGACYDEAAPVTTQILFSKGKSPVATNVTREEFFR